MNNLDTIRNDKGELPAFAWPGGYPMFYVDGDGQCLCATCATKSLNDPDEIPSFKPIAYDVYYEGPTMQCDNCNADIESAYGDPDEEVQP